jgi:hypothetical protein
VLVEVGDVASLSQLGDLLDGIGVAGLAVGA